MTQDRISCAYCNDKYGFHMQPNGDQLCDECHDYWKIHDSGYNQALKDLSKCLDVTVNELQHVLNRSKH